MAAEAPLASPFPAGTPCPQSPPVSSLVSCAREDGTRHRATHPWNMGGEHPSLSPEILKEKLRGGNLGEAEEKRKEN